LNTSANIFTILMLIFSLILTVVLFNPSSAGKWDDFRHKVKQAGDNVMGAGRRASQRVKNAFETDPNKDPLVFKTKYGMMKGFYNHGLIKGKFTQLDLFKKDTPRAVTGIPFAKPPQGPLRFKTPVPYEGSWQGVRKFQSYPKPCPRAGFTESSEDCLYLNVYMPSKEYMQKINKPLPVMVWIYGGGFNSGSSNAWYLYDGRYLSKRHDVIVVTLNYRLGVIGFLVADGEEEQLDGNYGIQDQRLALEWVRENIAAFGGDPNRITLAGESAGALSVSIHLTSPDTPTGLFSSAILQSTPFGIHMRSRNEAAALGLELARNVSCVAKGEDGEEQADIDCLRQVPMKKFIKLGDTTPVRFKTKQFPLSNLYYWWPTVSGVIVDTPLNLMRKGEVKDVPMLFGIDNGETGLYTIQANLPIISMLDKSRDQFREKDSLDLYNNLFKDKTPQVLAKYPVNKKWKHNGNSQVQLTTDFIFRCPILASAQGCAESGRRVYVYQVEYGPKYISLGDCGKLMCHAMELPYIWRPVWMSFKTGEKSFSDHLTAQWKVFIYTGQLTSAPWEPFTEEKHAYVRMNTKMEQGVDLRKEHCDFWNKEMGYAW
jgi:carboxylesterase type B